MRHLSEVRSSSRRIAVIGGGIAGLSAAWLLSRNHQVTIFEKNGWAGGHANTVTVDCPEGPIPVDTGFIVYNPPNYPNFTALLDHLKVPSIPADMSLGVSIDSGRVEYSSRPHGLFGQASNFVSPRFWRLIGDIMRFYRHTRGLDASSVDDMSLGEFLDRADYSDALIDEHVLPMCAAIWSTTAAEMRDYPMRSFLRFFSSHGLLQVTGRSQWRTVKGGSSAYVSALVDDMGPDVAWRPAARKVTRRGGLSVVEDTSGLAEMFTDVVFGAHTDEALALLADPTDDERALLGAFRYTPNTAVLHGDRSLMPRRRSVWASWNYIGEATADSSRALCVSYWMNYLQTLPTRRPLFLTLNPVREPAPESVIQTFSYTHPLFNARALAAQDDLWRLQGARNTWFCGSYFGYGFHEDALQSGLAVAAQMGVSAPWGALPSRIATAPRLMEAAE